MAELGDMRFHCPACGDDVTVPARPVDSGKWSVAVAIDLSVVREHYATAHPELAEPAGEAVTGERLPEPVEYEQPRR